MEGSTTTVSSKHIPLAYCNEVRQSGVKIAFTSLKD